MKWWWQLNKSAMDLERELRSDLELEEEEQRKSGLPPEEARYAARRAFGNEVLIKEQTREAWGWVPFERVSQDVRFAIRQLAKNKGFTAACVITLALGVGATVTIFTVMDSLLLRPLPYPNSPRVVRIWNIFAPRGMMEIPVSEPEFVEYRQSHTFAHLAGFSVGALTLTESGDPLRVAASWGTSDFFAVMGTEPLLGRTFSADELQPGHTQVGILSYRLWRNRFDSNPKIVGKSILLNGQSCVVVGVMPLNFNLPSNDVDIWQPLPIAPASSNLGNHYLNLIADLKQGATLEQARSEMATILTRIQRKISSVLRRGRRDGCQSRSLARTDGRKSATHSCNPNGWSRVYAPNSLVQTWPACFWLAAKNASRRSRPEQLSGLRAGAFSIR